MSVKRLLLLPHIKVHNANALSSPFTIGFPAMTAWLGAAHALQRKLNNDGFTDLVFNSTAVISHKANLQTHKGRGDYVHSIIGTANPLDKDGSRSAFIEEARCHLEVSLVIEFDGITKEDEETCLKRVNHHLNFSMKLAGGDILQFNKPTITRVDDDEEEQVKAFSRKLMPGFALVQRDELMKEAMCEKNMDAMDALLDFLVIHNSSEMNENEVLWTSKKRSSGWLVPIAIGFQGISVLGNAKNQRDEKTPHRFAESVVTLGEFIMPYKIDSLDEILWHYHFDSENSLYLCKQNNL